VSLKWELELELIQAVALAEYIHQPWGYERPEETRSEAVLREELKESHRSVT
jgi:hypothetical protein